MNLFKLCKAINRWIYYTGVKLKLQMRGFQESCVEESEHTLRNMPWVIKLGILKLIMLL